MRNISKVFLITISILFSIFCILLYNTIKFNLKVLSYTLENNLYCNQAFCPIQISKSSLISIPQNISPDLSAENVIFFRSVCNFVAAIIDASLKKEKFTLFSILQQIDLDQSPMMAIASSIDDNTIIFGIRGTQTGVDAMQDTHIKQVFVPSFGLVHDGFYQVYLQIKNALNMSLFKNVKNIVFTGHSLGAAAATLLALDFKIAFPDKFIYLITFASPRVGDEQLKNSVDTRILHVRFQNDADIITNLPASVSPNYTNPSQPWLYYHSGFKIGYNDNWKSGLNNHNVANYLNFLSKYENSKISLQTNVSV